MSDEKVDAYPLRATDKIRYADTDRQGHVNNATFAQFLETGRVEMLYDPAAPLASEGASFVIARLALDFRSELTWPGHVHIGTRVTAVGKSSLTLQQGIFQGARCVAIAETVIVQVEDATRRARPLSDATAERLRSLQRQPPEDT